MVETLRATSLPLHYCLLHTERVLSSPVNCPIAHNSNTVTAKVSGFFIKGDLPDIILPSEVEVSVRLSAHAEVRGVAYCKKA